jgi:hypothetical protein
VEVVCSNLDTAMQVNDDVASAKPAGALVCIECGDEDGDDGRGWCAYVFEDAILVYCPDCAEREFEDAN